MNNLEQAIAYANKKGWYVFPTREKPSLPFETEDGIEILPVKSPYTTNGFLDASRDVDVIKAWWEQHPNAGIGVSCGHSNLVVIDIDTKDGRKGFENFMNLHVSDEGALHSITPSGGAHIVYSGQVRSRANRWAGIDIRSKGAYIVAPPSWIYDDNGEKSFYIAVDDWERIPVDIPPSLDEKLDKLAGKEKKSSGQKFTKQESPEETIRRVRDALDKIPSQYCDEYFSWISVGLALKTLGDSGFELWDAWSRKSSKYTPKACTYRWKKFNPNEIGLGTIFYLAKEGGYNGK